MAKLSRWNSKYIPKWLGNDKAPEPFAVEIARRTYGDLMHFNECWQAAMKLQTPDAWLQVFVPYIRGPIGACDVDGDPCRNMSDIAKLCASEIATEGSLAHELSEAILEVNGLGKAARTSSAQPAGGSGGTGGETTG